MTMYSVRFLLNGQTWWALWQSDQPSCRRRFPSDRRREWGPGSQGPAHQREALRCAPAPAHTEHSRPGRQESPLGALERRKTCNHWSGASKQLQKVTPNEMQS